MHRIDCNYSDRIEYAKHWRYKICSSGVLLRCVAEGPDVTHFLLDVTILVYSIGLSLSLNRCSFLHWLWSQIKWVLDRVRALRCVYLRVFSNWINTVYLKVVLNVNSTCFNIFSINLMIVCDVTCCQGRPLAFFCSSNIVWAKPVNMSLFTTFFMDLHKKWAFYPLAFCFCL